MEKCRQITVQGASQMIKCANIVVKALPAVIDLTSVTCPIDCFVGDTVTVTVTCTNTSVTAGVANLVFTTIGTGTPTPAIKSIGCRSEQRSNDNIFIHSHSPEHHAGWLC